jgi:acylphosphatase
MVELHLIGKGHVQGVFFRSTTRDLAIGLRLNGWVKNKENGEVELIAQGEKENVENLVKELKKQFDANFTCRYSSPKKIFDHFTIIR